MKRLIFCFDGTWNKIDAADSTNVVMTAESVMPLAKKDNTAQLIYYDEGVGTAKGKYLRGGVLGEGVVQNLSDAYRFLIFNYTPGDEIYIFGFSRGAYTARSFAGLMNSCGIWQRREAGNVKEAIALYRKREVTPEFVETMMVHRREHSPDVCVSDKEDEWRVQKVPGYTAGVAPRLYVTYMGVWDTVGALGVPARFPGSNWINRRHFFHDTSLSEFVRSARHAVAIDEKRRDFPPTLWSNLDELNKKAGTLVEANDARYQQVWFPGTHSSVGGGGERRGLSDQALSWVWDGARIMGLELDAAENSRIYELAPNYAEFIGDTEEPGFFYRMMNLSAADRLPGPTHLYEVSLSARRRYHEMPEYLSDKKLYRPATLSSVQKELEALDPAKLGVGAKRETFSLRKYKMYEIKKGENLQRIAERFYGNVNEWEKIFDVNRDQVEDANRIYAGTVLRLPREGMTAEN